MDRKKFKIIAVFGLVFFAGMVGAGLFNMGLSATNEMAFCTSCHTMKIPYEEYQQSMHWQNASGIRADCADCHVPKEFGPKMVAKVLAYKDVLHEILGTINTPEKYEAHRWDMANRVWDKMRATDSRECRSCHEWESMDLSAQDRMARNRHGRARDEGQTCIDCHQGIVHRMPDEPRDGA